MDHSLGRGVGAAVITPAANMECMNLRLAEISTQVAPGSIAALICEGAGWHQRGGDIKLPDNIVLLPLPPYAPELNPMENVWDYLRANKLSACVWDSYDEILKACADAWNWFVNDPRRIQSIGNLLTYFPQPPGFDIYHEHPVLARRGRWL